MKCLFPTDRLIQTAPHLSLRQPFDLGGPAGTHLDLRFGVSHGDTQGAPCGARAGPLLLSQQLGACTEGMPHLSLVYQVLGTLKQRGPLASWAQGLSLLLHFDLFGERGQVVLLFPLFVFRHQL